MKVISYNLHLGFNLFRRKDVLEKMLLRLINEDADVYFLQEVPFDHPYMSSSFEILFKKYKTSFHKVKEHYSIGCQANMICSRFDVLESSCVDLTYMTFEHRGLLVNRLRQSGQEFIVGSIHLGLSAPERVFQIKKLTSFLKQSQVLEIPCLIGGDFNHWKNKLEPVLLTQNGLFPVLNHKNKFFPTYPSYFPVLPLDRFYHNQGIVFDHYYALPKKEWKMYSDHLPVVFECQLLKHKSDQ